MASDESITHAKRSAGRERPLILLLGGGVLLLAVIAGGVGYMLYEQRQDGEARAAYQDVAKRRDNLTSDSDRTSPN